MNSKYRLLILIQCLLLVIVLSTTSGCGSNINNNGPVETKIVVDVTGREVEIPAKPQRVACFYASTSHMMAMLDVGDLIVGTVKGVKTDVLMQMKYPEIVELATPFNEGSINVEELLRINADLALVRSATAAKPGEMEKLDQLNIPYVIVDYTTLDDVRKAITVMGEVFEEQEKAQAYLDFMDDTISMTKERIGEVDEADMPMVYHSVNEAIRTDTPDNICIEIMNLAGINNPIVSSEMNLNDGGYTTLEEIYKWDPDAIIANEYSVTDYILTDSKWAGLRAVKEKEVFTLPIGISRWCHHGSIEPHMGVLSIAQIFYPEGFSDFDMTSYTRDYYKNYYGLELDDDTLASILDGKGMHKSNSPT